MKKVTGFAALLILASAAMAQSTNPPPANTAPAGTMQKDPARPGMSNTMDRAAGSAAETDLRKRMMTEGYTDVQGLTRNGESWNGTAMYKGQRYKVHTSPDGKVMRTPHK